MLNFSARQNSYFKLSADKGTKETQGNELPPNKGSLSIFVVLAMCSAGASIFEGG